MDKQLFRLLSIFVALIILHSCKKEIIDSSKSSQVISNLNELIEMPTVSEGRLNFKTENQLMDYYNWLVNEIKNRDIKKFAKPDSLLPYVDNDLRFYSAKYVNTC